MPKPERRKYALMSISMIRNNRIRNLFRVNLERLREGSPSQICLEEKLCLGQVGQQQNGKIRGYFSKSPPKLLLIPKMHHMLKILQIR